MNKLTRMVRSLTVEEDFLWKTAIKDNLIQVHILNFLKNHLVSFLEIYPVLIFNDNQIII